MSQPPSEIGCSSFRFTDEETEVRSGCVTFTRPYSRGSESKAKEKEREGPSCPRMELVTQAAAKEAAACSPEARSAHSRRFDGGRSAAPQTENTHGSGDGAPPGHLSRRPALHRPSLLASGSDPISLTLRCLASQLQRPVLFKAFVSPSSERSCPRAMVPAAAL